MPLTKDQRRTKIKRRIRKKFSGTPTKPRLSVFRSNKEIYAQIIDDENTLPYVSYGYLYESHMNQLILNFKAMSKH